MGRIGLVLLQISGCQSGAVPTALTGSLRVSLPVGSGEGGRGELYTARFMLPGSAQRCLGVGVGWHCNRSNSIIDHFYFSFAVDFLFTGPSSLDEAICSRTTFQDSLHSGRAKRQKGSLPDRTKEAVVPESTGSAQRLTPGCGGGCRPLCPAI